MWDEQSTWYIRFDHTAIKRENLELIGLCGNLNGDPDGERTVLCNTLLKPQDKFGELRENLVKIIID